MKTQVMLVFIIGLVLTVSCANVDRKECDMSVSDNSPGKGTEGRCISSAATSQEGLDYKWVNVTNDAAYAPRDGAGALVFKGKIWLLGGWHPYDKEHFPRICNNEVWSSADGKIWTLEKPNTFKDNTFDPTLDWEGRHTAGYVVHKDKMWIVGGDCNQKHYQGYKKSYAEPFDIFRVIKNG